MTAAGLIIVMELYLWAGAAVAAVFLLWGLDRIDEDARGAYVFRPLLVPGCVLLWPVVLWRWYILETGRDSWPLRHMPPRAAHGWAAVVLAAGLALMIGLGFAAKQTWPADIAPQRLSEAAS